MAKAAAAKNSESTGGAPEASPNPPSGFKRRSAVTDAPWVETAKGNVCQGRLLNRYVMNNSDPVRYYYQVELSHPCQVRIGRGEDAEVQTAQAGEIVNLNENHKTSCLKEVEVPEIIAGGVYDVWVKFEDKIKIGGGKTMWNIDVQSKQLKAPTSQVRPLLDDGGDGGADDTPF